MAEQIDIGLKRCGQQLNGGEQCPCVASYRYTWPGRAEAFICGECVPKLRAVAAALGCYVQIAELPLPPPPAGRRRGVSVADRKYCNGCRDDFYNTGRDDFGGSGDTQSHVRECWSLKTAKVVTRYRLGWWTQPTSRKAFAKVKTHDCHHAPGRYAHYKALPDDLLTPKERARKALAARAEPT